MKPLRILWISDPPETPSAYANQTALFLPRLRAAGHEVALLATNNAYVRWLADGTPVFPVVSDRHGNTIVREHARRFGADLVLTLTDPHVLAAEVYADLPWCAWAPLDFETPTRATIAILKKAKWVWSPSKHGAEAYRKAGRQFAEACRKEKSYSASLENASWVPHGIDSTTFDVLDRGDARTALAASIGVEIADDAFLAVAVAANRGSPSRKGFYEMFAAWKIFSDEHPNAILYVHTEVTGLGGIGEDLRAIADLVSLRQGTVFFPPQYEYVCGMLGPEHLAIAYNAADVYLSTSHGEGFGLGAYEAQMCGCPVIVPDNTAQTEACLTGSLSRVMQYMPFDGGTLWGRPAVGHVVDLLEEAYVRGGDRSADRTRERALVYDADRIFAGHFLHAIDRIAKEL